MNAACCRLGTWPRRPRGSRGGFSLVEVLITTAVTVIAFVGMVSLQMLALRAAGSALCRSQATALVYEMIDRLRLNRGGDGFNDTAFGGGYDDATLCRGAARHPYSGFTCELISATQSLSRANPVTDDLHAWWSAIDAADLPGWYAMIQRDGELFRVVIQWYDARAEGRLATAGSTTVSCLGSTMVMPGTMQEVCMRTQL